ncbi:MAG TPA: 30S ribosomal protein S6 [Candidatus Limnocylindrales bacterium]|nr:30S ribosomal protein S6 [Candidatus Limnocylindrales bacterium]
MRRYELMLVLKPDAPDERSQAVIDRTTRQIVAAGGQIVKVAPWGRRRLAYPIDRYREGSYQIIVFEAPAPALAELERSLLITEEVIRHLITRVERPVRPGRRDGAAAADSEGAAEDEGSVADEDEGSAVADESDDERDETIDEFESEAAPAAID